MLTCSLGFRTGIRKLSTSWREIWYSEQVTRHMPHAHIGAQENCVTISWTSEVAGMKAAAGYRLLSKLPLAHAQPAFAPPCQASARQATQKSGMLFGTWSA